MCVMVLGRALPFSETSGAAPFHRDAGWGCAALKPLGAHHQWGHALVERCPASHAVIQESQQNLTTVTSLLMFPSCLTPLPHTPNPITRLTHTPVLIRTRKETEQVAGRVAGATHLDRSSEKAFLNRG